MSKTVNLAGVVIVSILLLATTTGRAEIITYQLPPAFEREYNYDDPYLAMDFDLGVAFTEILSVYIDWSGEITGGLAQNYDPITFEPVGEPYPIEVGVYASLGSNPSPRWAQVWGGVASYPDPELFNVQNEVEALTGPTNWSDLLDGQGTITIGYTELIMLYGGYVEHGSVTLNDVTLEVHGAVIPEPATVLLLGFGGLILRA